MFTRKNIKYQGISLPFFHDMTDAEMQMAALDYIEFMQHRHSVRNFSDRPIPRNIIENCVKTAGTAPSGANHQPWHFVAIANPEYKRRIREASEAEGRKFYAGGAGDEWLKAIEPIGTDEKKPHLEIAPWLIVVFAQRYGQYEDGEKFKNYNVPESVGIATGFLLAALHHAGLTALIHMPNPMEFLNEMLGRPKSEKPTMIIAVGHPAKSATVPEVAKIKKPLHEILTICS
ncbi:MAG: nitroreductase family protein [Rhodobacteraceae bacterium]|nr:nitroreductase family protein [Paracoccaceae bacterium]